MVVFDMGRGCIRVELLCHLELLDSPTTNGLTHSDLLPKPELNTARLNSLIRRISRSHITRVP